jgi:hypothetical protein
MNTNSVSETNGPGSPYDPFPTPRIYPDKWDLSELVPGYRPVGDSASTPPAASAAGQDTTSMTDGFTDESTENTL